MFNPDNSVFVIAEAGINHNGSLDLAMEMVDVASAVGADAIKFQTFDASLLVTSSAQKAPYQQMATNEIEPQQKMLSRLQLDRESHYQLKRRAEACGLLFMSTAFDSQSLDFLVNDLDLAVLKIPSGEVTNGPLLLEYAQAGRDLVLSTGMSTLTEVETALSVLAFGLEGKKSPSADTFKRAFISEEGRDALRMHITLLHCTTQYPAPYDSVNLNALPKMQHTFGLRVGYSDHTPGTTIASAAVAMGARVIEKHFTLDKSLPGPDHRASLEGHEFGRMVENIRIVEQSLGDGEKAPHEAELENLPMARKSLVAARNIQQGERFSPDNITIKRPGTGRSPMEYWSIMGQRSKKEYDFDELL